MGQVIFINIADMTNPDTGKTYRQENTEKQHNISIGSLVELVPDEYGECTMIGARLFVVGHNRDCDMTPLYSLAADWEDIEVDREGFGNRKWYNGIPEEWLKVIKTKQ